MTLRFNPWTKPTDPNDRRLYITLSKNGRMYHASH